MCWHWSVMMKHAYYRGSMYLTLVSNSLAIACEMHFMKSVQVFMTKRVERRRTGQEADTVAVKCPRFLDLDLSQQAFRRAWGLGDTCMPTGVGHSHMISILLLFIGHLGSRKTGPSQWCKEGSKAQCFGLVKCTIKPFKMSSTRQRLKTNVAFWLSMGTT